MWGLGEADLAKRLEGLVGFRFGAFKGLAVCVCFPPKRIQGT